MTWQAHSNSAKTPSDPEQTQNTRPLQLLLADDDAHLRKGLTTFLQNEGFETVTAENGKKALDLVQKSRFDLIISDVQMPEMSGIQLLENLRKRNILTPIIIITAFASIEDAVKAMQMGADDYVTKPLNLLELKIRINRIMHALKLQDENRALKERLRKIEQPDIIGVSKKMDDVRFLIQKIAADDNVSVMIYGASGTGKELVAKNIHRGSARRKKPFVAVNCAALPDDLLESELFGYKKGAFTGAMNDKPGFFQAADGGTLFLDEVGDMSERLQAKLLRVLQDRMVQPLGGTVQKKVDVRILGASNKNLMELVSAGTFREDLYYRLNVVAVHLPPLKERPEDIPMLLGHFSRRGEQNPEGKPLGWTSGALSLLQKYEWPGNIRELENLVRMLSVFHAGKVVTEGMLPDHMRAVPGQSGHNQQKHIHPEDGQPGHIHPGHGQSGHIQSEWGWPGQTDSSTIRQMHMDYQSARDDAIHQFEEAYLANHLDKHGGNISKTAEAIGLSRVSLYKKIKEYGLKNL